MNSRSITTFSLALGAVLLSTCSSVPEIDFERMSVADLMAYNRTVEFGDQIHCAEEIRAGSHIRRRHCETLTEMQDRIVDSAASLNVIGTSRIF